MSSAHLPVQKNWQKTSLSMAISMALALPAAQAATFNVSEPQDDGTGLVADTLSWAILQANTTAGDDVIELNTDVTITGVMKRLIDSNTILQSDAIRRTIDGNNQFRPLFIKSGQVTIQDLDIENGLAEGGSSHRGGKGAGLGGAVFLYSGSSIFQNISIRNSIATGNPNIIGFGAGGAGMYGTSSQHGGGLFADADGIEGGYGGYGNYQYNDANFGQGGLFDNNVGEAGGFGAGGGYGYNQEGGAGGFGAGGGYSYYGNGGNGGFGAGGGNSEFGVGGVGGFGAVGVNAAGFGGGIFVRSGSLQLNDVTIENSQANSTGTVPNNSEGFGGAVFILHTSSNTNNNNQGMPSSLPNVNACGITFTNNIADTDPNSSNNNDDIFDLGNRITASNGVSITEPCGIPDQEIQLTGNDIEIIDGDTTPDLTDGSDLGAVEQSSDAISQQFSINNLGTFSLQLTGDPLVELVDNNNNQFSITQLPNATIGGNGSSGFEVTFTPGVVVGVDTATVIIASNDTDENPYEFTVQAEVLPATPEISVTGNGITIEDGDSTPDMNDFTSMGQAQESAQSITQTFSINNEGLGDLLLTGMPIVELQNNNGQFSVTAQPSLSTVGSNEQVSFDLTFTPTSMGVDSATVVIQNNDSDESTYDFVIEAEGVAQAGIIQVSGNGLVIANGDEDPQVDDGTDFGFTPVIGGLIEHEFEITNVGFADIDVAGVSSNPNTSFIFISQQPSLISIQPQQSTTFKVIFAPSFSGQISGVDIDILGPSGLLHMFQVTGYGQPTITINTDNNYLQEGETAEFTVTADVPIEDFSVFDWQVNGQVDGLDFGGDLPSGNGFVDSFNDQALIQVLTVQDGIYEGPEIFNVSLTTSDPRLNIGFPNVSGGVIDDDLIYVDGFDALGVNQLIANMGKYAIEIDELPVCDSYACNFYNRSMTLGLDKNLHGAEALVWFEETLVLMQPFGDWDGDGLPNNHDLNPFGIEQNLLEKFYFRQ